MTRPKASRVRKLLPKDISAVCLQCKTAFHLKNSQRERWARGETDFFCGKSCSMTYRHAHHPTLKASIQAANRPRADQLREQLKGARALAARPETRARMRATMIARGHRPTKRGGNGQGMSDAQTALQVALWQETGVEWAAEHVIPTRQNRQSGYPTCYKVDLADASLKVAVEVDGPSHSSSLGKARDQKKQALLESFGWRVLRFCNQEVVRDATACARMVMSTISK